MYKYFSANISPSKTSYLEDKYIPFDWSVGEIVKNTEGVKLTWRQAMPTEKQSVRLRITSATDVREVLILEVRTAVSQLKIAEWNIQFAAYMQPFELDIPNEFVAAVFTEGIQLTIKEGTQYFWFFQANSLEKGAKIAPNAFLPHLLVHEKRLKSSSKNGLSGLNNEPHEGLENSLTTAWKDRFLSLESVQTFGWMQGVVLDGLLEMSQRFDAQITSLFFHAQLYLARPLCQKQ